ncbi:MAG: hypothetical protein A2Y71_07780, partial [Bacteroidetes bacterium RBG_13_42_15]
MIIKKSIVDHLKISSFFYYSDRMKAGRIIFITRNIFVLSVLISFIVFPVFSQNQGNKTVQPLSTTEELDYREKIFLHSDRKIYLTGEIIWFKGYCVHRTFNLPVDLSKVMYIEILNDQNKLILSEKIRLSGGTGHGSIYIPRSIQTGIYYIRAYTRWMTNFDPEYYFIDRIFIVNPFLSLETINDHPGISREYSIHFYAEKNRLISGKNNDIAFRAVDQAGNGVNLNGWVVNTSADTMSSFTTYKYGFGLISFTPWLNDQYRIITVDSDGGEKEIPLKFQVLQNSLHWSSCESNTMDNGKKFNISIQQNKTGYITREKVTLTLRTTDSGGQPVSGNMSISVYKSDEQVNFYHKNIYQYLYHTSDLPGSLMPPDDQIPFSEYDSEMLQKILYLIYSSFDKIDQDDGSLTANGCILPENRGIMVSGTIINSQDGNPAPGVRVFLAKPGKNAQLYNVKSGAEGKFSIQVLDQYGRNDIIMMPEKNPEKYMIILDDDFSGKYGNVHPVPFRPDEQTIRYLEKLMMNLQIKDAFGEILPGHFDIFPNELPNIFGAPEETVLLEDYIRLPAVEELFVELVKKVFIERRRSRFRLTVIDPETVIPIIGEPLLLLDGVPVLDINPVITYMDPIDIEKIEVLSSWYIIGDKFYFSVINLITKQAEYGHFELPYYAIRKQFHFLQYPVSFDSPDHSVKNDSLLVIPDFRNLLYWNPEVVTDVSGIATVSFFTSDDISNYRIVVQGLT